ncbi:hypothetical protein [Endozoicomonas sp. SCSIO W0465]|uniref:hypothetical protein n=1 Tax=Endozoicomonas sp. SCSIO W0465 TaxID=2918516 RepID=UPI0020757651|nr:hypothetical protein [Endozoicomonas sp. SCSIO W0465]USE38846.1 hypothetical protein MJO57_12160 [Endozoicomonas sp. SCSIO W0465]
MLANIVEKWCLRGWYKNQKIPDLCGGAEQLRIILPFSSMPCRLAQIDIFPVAGHISHFTAASFDRV